MVKPAGKFVQVAIPDLKTTMGFDHGGLVFFARNIVGSCVCNINETKRMLKICSMKNIIPITEMYDWLDFPKAYAKLKDHTGGKPHFRLCVNVGEWARKNGFHKERF